jgi:hypothetical protein
VNCILGKTGTRENFGGTLDIGSNSKMERKM